MRLQVQKGVAADRGGGRRGADAAGQQLRRSSDHALHLPADLPLVPLDSVLIEQVLVNLLENAIKYTPPGSPIDIAATATIC